MTIKYQSGEEITEETKGVEAEIIPISTPMGEIIPLSVPEPVFIPEPIKVVEEQIPTQSIEIPIGAPVFKAPAF